MLALSLFVRFQMPKDATKSKVCFRRAYINLHLRFRFVLLHPYPPILIVSMSLTCFTLQERKTSTKAASKPRATKAKKDKNAPKRALSAYMFFSQDWRERIKAENPDASFGQCPPSVIIVGVRC